MPRRSHNNPNVWRLYDVIVKYPGLRPRQYEVILGMNYGNSESLLCALDQNGLLLYEDDAGRLYRFDPEE
jgi:hypothetical protein